ncbi:RHS repeat-associated core domain-containing protein [Aliiroseovarius halocynthiae]|uniref:RHS repeat-associated core domain-containing protein n=1 Tax=Aliiroseovarius halocynthiae TaxID=985055 RepID=A0A545SLF6_9RHOB|nr:RHS repeat-associated core domain-containing protein [Aliiroseovarius halocynthiae]TQV65791.1 hypothetical protein FIL88_15960 [Aliiroseovarius halocynthiae]
MLPSRGGRRCRVYVRNGLVVLIDFIYTRWFQSESGLHQNWMRDYDPTTGRYIQADPLGLVDGASVYNYALQNPGRYVDPRGEETATMGGSASSRAAGTWGRRAATAGAMCAIDGPVPAGDVLAALFIIGATAYDVYRWTISCNECSDTVANRNEGNCYAAYERRNDECRRMMGRTDRQKRRRQQCWEESADLLAECQRKEGK